MIYPSLYNAPVVYYALLLSDSSERIIEGFDNYTKQTYRNRCSILGGNGKMDLVIPVVKDHGNKTRMKDVRIDHDAPWRQIHWKSINAAYAASPFFEFISDPYRELYKKKIKYLYDLNMELISITLDVMGADSNLQESTEYLFQDPDDDIREAIHPKRPFKMNSVEFTVIPYHQVFEDRYGFSEGLSILDLLFNEGQNTADFLKRSIRINE